MDNASSQEMVSDTVQQTEHTDSINPSEGASPDNNQEYMLITPQTASIGDNSEWYLWPVWEGLLENQEWTMKLKALQARQWF